VIEVGGDLYENATFDSHTLSLDWGLLPAGLEPGGGDSFWDSDHSWKIVDVLGTNADNVNFSSILGAGLPGFTTSIGDGVTGDLGDIYLDYTPIELPSVAITEFMADTTGDENVEEFVELYNFGAESLDLTNWVITDDDNNDRTLGPVSLDAGETLVLVRSAADFLAVWPSVDPGVLFEVNLDSIANSSDELVLRDADGNEVWRLAYSDGDPGSDGYGWHLMDSDFTHRYFGDKSTPGLVPNGPDNTGTLGYEYGFYTSDPYASTSTTNNVASPGTSSQAIPEPNSLALLGLLGLGALFRRRRARD
jgi:hypothetical protein